MDAPGTQASLPRFVGGRGRDFLNFGTPKKSTAKILVPTIGSLALMLGAIYASSYFTTNQSFLVQMSVLMLAIFASSAISSKVTKRLTKSPMQTMLGERTKPLTLANGVVVTPEAQQMTMMLHWYYWSQDPASTTVMQQLGKLPRYMRKWAAKSFGEMDTVRQKSAAEAATAPAVVLDLLEKAAFEYNRAIGLVQSEEAAEIRPSVVQVGDGAIVSAFDRARKIVKDPASLSANEGALIASVEVLRELADGVAALTAMHGFGPTMGLSGLLDELRRKVMPV